MHNNDDNGGDNDSSIIIIIPLTIINIIRAPVHERKSRRGRVQIKSYIY